MTEYYIEDGSPTFGTPQARIAILLADHKQFKMLGPQSGLYKNIFLYQMLTLISKFWKLYPENFPKFQFSWSQSVLLVISIFLPKKYFYTVKTNI